jgi:SAM-dependent methyltransferase
MSQVTNEERIKQAVRDAYGRVARRFVEDPSPGRASCCGPSLAVETEDEKTAESGCCGSSGAVEQAQIVELAEAASFYPADELADLPDTVTGAALGCGNPLAIAELQPGDVVLDLGSGGGIDCFLAAKKVGSTGRVIGLDMTPDMIKLARRNAKKLGATNVDFRFGEMEEMPLPDESVDVIISNCVINLSPDKDAVFREAYRVLRPGGRLSVSDIVIDGDLPQVIRDRLDAWAGCIAGALDERVYLDKIRAAGFERVEVLSRDYNEVDEGTEWGEVQVIVAGDDGQEARITLDEADLTPHDLARKVASVKVRAYKPA